MKYKDVKNLLDKIAEENPLAIEECERNIEKEDAAIAEATAKRDEETEDVERCAEADRAVRDAEARRVFYVKRLEKLKKMDLIDVATHDEAIAAIDEELANARDKLRALAEKVVPEIVKGYGEYIKVVRDANKTWDTVDRYAVDTRHGAFWIGGNEYIPVGAFAGPNVRSNNGKLYDTGLLAAIKAFERIHENYERYNNYAGREPGKYVFGATGGVEVAEAEAEPSGTDTEDGATDE